jgi:hypothetical protein
MMTRTPNEIGNALEERARKALSGERVTQSGGGKFWKLDVRSRVGWIRFVWSCKGTDKHYLHVTTDMLREAREAARGMRGTGDGYTAGMVLGIGEEAYVLVRLDDFAELMAANPSTVASATRSSKAAERRAGARRFKLG